MIKIRKGLERKSSLKRTRLKSRYKPTGELELFKELYFAQSGKSALSGMDLFPPGHPAFHMQGSHLLPKGTYPDYRLDKRNIVMILPSEHETWERIKNKDILVESDNKWSKIVELYYLLKREAYGVDTSEVKEND